MLSNLNRRGCVSGGIDAVVSFFKYLLYICCNTMTINKNKAIAMEQAVTIDVYCLYLL